MSGLFDFFAWLLAFVTCCRCFYLEWLIYRGRLVRRESV